MREGEGVSLLGSLLGAGLYSVNSVSLLPSSSYLQDIKKLSE
jgi:hypothetical protein